MFISKIRRLVVIGIHNPHSKGHIVCGNVLTTDKSLNIKVNYKIFLFKFDNLIERQVMKVG